MSLITNGQGAFSRDLWGIDDVRFANDIVSVDGCTAEWQMVPHDLEDIASWLDVKLKASREVIDRTRTFQVIHTDLDGADESFEVEIRLQGLLTDFNLTPGGNLRQEADKARARQTVTLKDIGSTDAWTAQTTAIAKLRYAVLRSLPNVNIADVELDLEPHEKLSIQRQAFIKGGTQSVKGSPTRGSWRYAPALDLKRRDPNGSIVNASHITFSRGDFVDVLASLEVVRRGIDRRSQVHLHLESVVQLKTAAEMFMNVPTIIGVLEPPQEVAPKRKRGRDYNDAAAAVSGEDMEEE